MKAPPPPYNSSDKQRVADNGTASAWRASLTARTLGCARPLTAVPAFAIIPARRWHDARVTQLHTQRAYWPDSTGGVSNGASVCDGLRLVCCELELENADCWEPPTILRWLWH